MTAQAAQQLVGRTAELAALDRALGALEQRRFGALELVGEPGIGKTRLLAELAARADARGHLVLAGSASELESELPFWPFVDALDDYLQALEPRRAEALGDDARAELANVFPSMPPAPRPAAPQEHRFRTHRAVRGLLEVLATKPLVLVLDDLHWADSGSIELLGALLRRPPSGPILIAAAVRPRQAPATLAGALEHAERSGSLTRLELAPLSRAEAGELLGAGVARAHASALYEESGGNPFYLRQLARAPQRDGSGGAGDALAGIEVPRSVAAALAREVAQLSGDARGLLAGAAVAGDPFEADLAAIAAELDRATALAALDDLLAQDLVRATDVPRRFRFQHPLVRRAVYEIAPGGWRLAAHERCATALAQRGAPPTARAHHVEHAAQHGDATAIAVLRAAGEATLHRNPAGAARWFAAALRLLPAAAPAGERVELLVAQAGAMAATGRFADAHALLVESIRNVPGDAVALRVRLIVACAGAEQLLGRHDDGRARLLRALDELGDDDSAQAVELYLALASNNIYLQEYAGAREWAQRAHDLARALADPGLVADAGGLLAIVCAFTNDVSAARSHRDATAALIDAMPDEALAERILTVSNLAGAEAYLNRVDDGIAHARRGLELARATRQEQRYTALAPMLLLLLTMAGRLVEAEEHTEDAVEAARVVGNVQGLAWALFNRAYLATHRGDIDDALAAAEESAELMRGGEGSVLHTFAGLVLAIVLIERGDPRAGAELLVARGGGAALPLVPGSWRVHYLDQLARAHVALAERTDAERAAATAAELAATSGLAYAEMAARRAAARIALEHDPAAAATHALASAAAAESFGARVEGALSRTLAGVALARGGANERALAELGAAAATLDACGAVRRRDAAERELRALGQRKLHRRSRAGAAGGAGLETLTQRELQVARLVVDRRTNAQIAAELFVSQRTVETHVRHLFEKLGVSSRVEVARVIERADRAARELSTRT